MKDNRNITSFIDPFKYFNKQFQFNVESSSILTLDCSLTITNKHLKGVD